MQKKCKVFSNHIARIEGQLRSLRAKIENEESCDRIVQLALSTSKSFDSLKTKLLELYIKEELLSESNISSRQLQDLDTFLKLSKS